jgi:hypothetical protein
MKDGEGAPLMYANKFGVSVAHEFHQREWLFREEERKKGQPPTTSSLLASISAHQRCPLSQLNKFLLPVRSARILRVCNLI